MYFLHAVLYSKPNNKQMYEQVDMLTWKNRFYGVYLPPQRFGNIWEINLFLIFILSISNQYTVKILYESEAYLELPRYN